MSFLEIPSRRDGTKQTAKVKMTEIENVEIETVGLEPDKRLESHKPKTKAKAMWSVEEDETLKYQVENMKKIEWKKVSEILVMSGHLRFGSSAG